LHPGKGITKDMGINLRSTHIGMPQQRLHRIDMQMVPHDVALIVSTQPLRGEQPLPLKRPRRVMMLVKAGQPVDDIIDRVIPYLEQGDIIIDGGNSLYQDTIRRTEYLRARGLLRF